VKSLSSLFSCSSSIVYPLLASSLLSWFFLWMDYGHCGIMKNAHCMICSPEHVSLVLPRAQPHYFQLESMIKVCVSIHLVMLIMTTEAVAAPARTQNVDSTFAYIRADYALVHAMKLSLSAVRADTANLVHEVSHNCPNAAAGSPNDEGAIELGVEALGAVGVVMSSIHRAAITQFFHSVIGLQWRNPKIADTTPAPTAPPHGPSTQPPKNGDATSPASVVVLSPSRTTAKPQNSSSPTSTATSSPKAYLSETATGLASKADTSEFGVPTVTAPAQYSWLGASELPTELPSGVITMGARSYVPQIGRFLQPDPAPGGSADAYTFGDPVNTNDPSGAYTVIIDQFDEEHLSQEAAASAAARAIEIRAAEEAAAREAAEQAVREAIAEGQLAGPQYAESEESREEEGSYGGGGGDDLHFITDKGGSGATCGSNSTNHRKCHEPHPSRRGENQEVCEYLGGALGGIIGSPGGVFGGAVGGAAGTVAGKEVCKE
jgi:RHS repeat-associated protein